MAKANPTNLNPQPPEVKTEGPVIEYIGVGAELVKFTINPQATRYVVNANGLIREYM